MRACAKLCAVIALSSLAGCGAAPAWLVGVQVAATSGVAYTALRRKDVNVTLQECVWAEKLKLSDEVIDHATRADLIQFNLHNRRVDCHCRKEKEACE